MPQCLEEKYFLRKYINEKPMIDFYVIGGYLGAGKTTFLNHILSYPTLTNTVVLVNDFGSLNIDAALIKNNDGKTYSLTNGCICCNIEQSFFTTLLKVIKSSPKPTRIIVEASGVADPSRIADIARLSPSMQLQKIIVVVDCATIRTHANNPQINNMVLKQLQSTDYLLLNKRDLVGDTQYGTLTKWIHTINADAKQIPCQNASVSIDEIISNTHTTHQKYQENNSINELQEQPNIYSETYYIHHPVSESTIREALGTLPDAIQRMKGFIMLKDCNKWALLQYVGGSQIRIKPIDFIPKKVLQGKLVYITTTKKPNLRQFFAILGITTITIE